MHSDMVTTAHLKVGGAGGGVALGPRNASLKCSLLSHGNCITILAMYLFAAQTPSDPTLVRCLELLCHQ